MTNTALPHTIDKSPATIRATCKSCGFERLHRCELVRMCGAKNIVKTICLGCGKAVTR